MSRVVEKRRGMSGGKSGRLVGCVCGGAVDRLREVGGKRWLRVEKEERSASARKLEMQGAGTSKKLGQQQGGREERERERERGGGNETRAPLVCCWASVISAVV